MDGRVYTKVRKTIIGGQEVYLLCTKTLFHFKACYKGYINAVARYIDHTRKSGAKNKLEQRTIDEYKATPLLMAALGGHIEVVELLMKNGADITAKLDYRSVKHGLLEIAVIREDLALLCLVFEKFSDSTKRVMTLMGLERLDIESRACVGRCIQRLSLEYNLKNSKIELDIERLRYFILLLRLLF